MPLDGSPLIRLEAILLPLFIVFAILATGGLIMVCFFVGFNVVFRNLYEIVSVKLHAVEACVYA